MENHTSASMYIPSSTVLARLQRHAEVTGRPKSGTPVLTAAPSVFSLPRSTGTLIETCTDTSESSGADGHSPDVKCILSCTHSPTSRDHQIGVSTPLESTTSGAAAAAHCTVSDAATPPKQFTTPCAAPPLLSPQIPGSGKNSAAAVEAPTPAQNCGAAQPISSASLPPASVWLLPQADVEYILSSLTWNVDLLRLLLSHASCPLHLPEAKPLAEVPPHTARAPPTAPPPTAPTATSPTPPCSSTMDEEEANADASRGPLAVRAASTGSSHGAMMGIGTSSVKTLQSAEAHKGSDAPISASRIEVGAANGAGDTYNNLVAVDDAPPNSSSSSPSSALTTDVREDEPPAAISTLPLTWSQYLFGGAGSRISTVVRTQADGVASVSCGVSDREQKHQRLSALARTRAPPPASARIARKTLPRSHSDGALMPTPNTDASRPPAPTSASAALNPSSIFHAQYLPSLKELERELEEHKHQQQQQQQHTSTLSVTRLEQHLLQQQQQSRSQHHRRRAATNRTFFYSPTPSVMSLSTTNATAAVHANTRDDNEDDEGEEEEQQQQQNAIRTTAVTSGLSHSHPYSSRPAPSQPRQLSTTKMMKRTADRLRATIAAPSSSAGSPSPLLLRLLHSRDGGLGHPTSDVIAHETAPDGEEGEEGTSSPQSPSERCSVWSPGSPPASPTVSLNSMSLSRAWSRTVSGRGTPQTILTTGLSCSGVKHNSNLIAGEFTSVSNASPYSTARGGKNARRRRKAKHTRRHRPIRVYMPSITEGPKAASLYTAPTAEAQELLLLLQQRKATALLHSGPSGWPMEGHGATTTALSPSPLMPGTYATADRAGLAASTTTTTSETLSVMQPRSSNSASAGVGVSTQEPEQQQQHSLPSPDSSPSMRPSRDKQAERSPHHSPTLPGTELTADTTPFAPLPQRAGVSGAGSATIRATDGSPFSAAHEQPYPHQPRPSPPLSASRCPPHSTCPLMQTMDQTEQQLSGDWVTSPLRSHATPTESLSLSWSGMASPIPPAATAALTQPKSSSLVGNRGEGGAGPFGVTLGVGGRGDAQVRRCTDAPARTCHEQSSPPPCTIVSAVSVELPQWVRERPLSALYYQPWGLELLARYEAARHEQQLMRGRMTGRDESNGDRSSSTISGAGVSRGAKQPLSTTASTVANSVSSSCNASLYSLSTAVRHPSMRLCSSFGTGGGGSNTTTTTPAAGAAGESPRSSACSLGISWAEALRRSQHITLTPGSSNVFGSARATATVKANRMTATATMNNCISINTATEQQQQPPPAVLPEWPPELLAAEEMDAWEEAYYFDRATTLPPWPPRQPHKNPTSRSGTKPLDSTTRHTKVDHTDDRNATSTTELAGCVAGPAAVAVSTKSFVQKKMQVNKEMQPSAPHLSRQRRSSRRRSRATYASDTFRSSAARRAGATSAAAELFHRRGDDNPTASAAVLKGAACPPTGQSPTPASVASIGDVTPYNDGHPRKNAAQLLCPKSSVQKAWTPLPPPPVFNSDHHAIGQGADASGSMALLLSVSLGGESDAMERDGTQQRVGMDNAHPAKGAQVKVDTSLRPVEPRDVDQAMEKSCRDKSEETTDDSCPRSSSSSSSSDAMKGAASVMSNTCDSAHAERPCTDVDVIFFLQKFIRAVLIVFIAQVRLQQQLQQHQQREVQAPTPHDMTCPVTAYLLEQQAQSQPIHGLHRWYPRHADPSDRAAAASHGSDEAGLSKLERCALAFVRNYMEDYRDMITACVMRDEREVARRSAQAILHPPRSATSSSSVLPPTSALFTSDASTAVAAVAKPEAMDSIHNTAPDPLFRQDVFARLLDADRVNKAYREAVRAATGGFLGAPDAIPPATPLDDVESLRTAQVYISGKDAAWQPLLMELLQMSRVVQCYGDGPVVAASGAPHATFSASAASPQRNLLSSLEKFLAHPTLPLLRQANPGAARATQALETVLAVPDPADFKQRTSTTTTTTLSLTPEQEKAAALMVEESDAFRIYLLSGYLRDTNNNNATAAAAAAAAVTAPTAMLRHSQSAPALSVREAQQWQESSVTTTAAMSPSRLFTAGSLLQPLTWYPYAYMPGTANPYAESSHPASTPKSAAEAATASAMTLSVTMLPLSGRLLWRWVVPAEDTDTFNLSVFFQSSLFSFMQGGPLPMPSAVPGQVVVGEWSCWSSPAAAAGGDCAAGYVPTPAVRSMAPPKPPHHPSVTWPPALAARIDAQLRSDAFRSAWGGVPPPCMCGNMAAAICKGHEEVPRADLWRGMPEVVLVHCSAGMHRSCGILVAFLLWLLYQCRQVLRSEQILNGGPPSHPRAPAPTRSAGVGIADQAAVEALLLNDTDTQTHAPTLAEDAYQTQQQQQSMSCMKNSAVDVKAPRLTSRLLQRTIRHVQQRRNIAVPIRTVQYLLQSFANELQLN